MSTIPLFEGDESVEDLCLLIKSLHEEMTTVHRKVDVLLAIKTDNTEALREMVASGPALDVVPNEDEATPVVTQEQYADMSWADRLDRLAKAKCPQCDRRAYSKEVVEAEFGYRTMEDGKVIVQSWCRECRALEQATSPRKLVRAKMPADIKALSTEATRLAHEGRTMIEEASAIIAASTGHVSKEALQKMKDGEAKLERSAALKSEYGKFQKASIKARRNNK